MRRNIFGTFNDPSPGFRPAGEITNIEGEGMIFHADGTDTYMPNNPPAQPETQPNIVVTAQPSQTPTPQPSQVVAAPPPVTPPPVTPPPVTPAPATKKTESNHAKFSEIAKMYAQMQSAQPVAAGNNSGGNVIKGQGGQDGAKNLAGIIATFYGMGGMSGLGGGGK